MFCVDVDISLIRWVGFLVCEFILDLCCEVDVDCVSDKSVEINSLLDGGEVVGSEKSCF